MRPVEFPEQNGVLGPPQQWPDDQPEVVPLPVFRDGWNVISCWELTDDEIEVMRVTKRIYIGVVGGPSQPPIFATALPPFTNVEDGE
ncbi:hypothetical protein GCM10027347_44560 [Larkinella harenae]